MVNDKQLKDLEKREAELDKLMKANEHDLNFMIACLPKAEELVKERKALVGLTFKQKIQYMKLKAIKKGFSRKIKRLQKSGEYSQVKI